MKKTFRIIVILLILGTIYSLLPVAMLYLEKDVKGPSNEKVARKLENNKGDNFAFIAFGDNHAGFIFDDSAALKVISRMNREDRFKKLNIDFVVNLGDVTFIKGTDWDYSVYDKLRARIKWPVITVIGNHDDEKAGERRFKEYLGQKEFAFANRNAYFIVLDNKRTDISDEQFAWLEEELKKSLAYKHRFIFMHKQALSLYQQSWFRPELSPWSYRFMKMCQNYKVDMVLAGHEHMFRKGTYGGVKYLISGGGGMLTQIPDQDGGYLHYIVVRIYGDYVDFEVRKVFPPLWEYFTYYIWKDLMYLLKDVFF